MRFIRVSVGIAAAVVVLAPAARADDAKVQKLEAEAKALKAKLAEVEAELLKLRGDTPVLLFATNIKAGMVGRIGAERDGKEYPDALTVQKVIGKDSMIVSPHNGSPKFFALVKGYDTGNVADGSVIEEQPNWKVTGKEARNGNTLWVLEPYLKK